MAQLTFTELNYNIARNNRDIESDINELIKLLSDFDDNVVKIKNLLLDIRMLKKINKVMEADLKNGNY